MNIRLNSRATLVVACIVLSSPFSYAQIDHLISQSNSNYIFFEAEDFSELHDATDGDSKWNKLSDGIQSSGVAKSEGLQAAKAIYKLDLSTGGDYTMYVRFKTEENGDGASFYVSDDAGSPFGIGKIETTGTTSYQWFNVVRISGFTNADHQTLVVFPDTAGVTIDKILLHNNGSLNVGAIDALGLTCSAGTQFTRGGLFTYGPIETNAGTTALVKNAQGAIMSSPSANQKYFPFNGTHYYTLNGTEGIMTLTLPDIGCFKNLATSEFKVCFWWMAPDNGSFTASMDYSLRVVKKGGMGGTTTVLVPGSISNATIVSNGFKYNKVEISSSTLDLTGKIESAKLFFEVQGSNVNDLIWIDDVSIFMVDDGSINPYVPPKINSLGITTTPGSPTVDFGASISGTMDGIESYMWDFGDGNTATTNTNVTSHTYATAGTFEVTLTVVDGDDVSNAMPCKSLRVTALATEPVSIPEAVFLPVELESFTAKATEEGIDIQWTTASELNNAYFLLEHSSDAIFYQTLDQFDGAGTVNTPQTYSFMHLTPSKGWNYYRLKQVDFDGTYTYSDIIPMQWNSEQERITLFPNPSSEEVTIKGLLGTARIIILDIQGRIIMQKNLGQQDRLDISTLDQGLYLIRILEDQADKSTNFRFVKN